MSKKYSEGEMVDIVFNWLGEETAYNQTRFIESRYSDLISYHSTLGRKIRNHFELWDVEWTPEVVGCADTSPNHPDAISMRIIQEVWRLAQVNLAEQ